MQNKEDQKINRLLMILLLLRAVISSDKTRINSSWGKRIRLRFKPKTSAELFYPDKLGEKQFTYFGDTNRTDRRIHNYFFGNRNTQDIIDSGVGHIFLEKPPSYQDIFDRVSKGEIDTSGFIAEMKQELPERFRAEAETDEAQETASLTVKFARALHAKGIRIHCVDDRSNIDPEHRDQIWGLLMGIIEYGRKHGASPAVLHGNLMLSYIWDDIFRPNLSNPEKIEDMLSDFIEASSYVLPARDDNTRLAEKISEIAQKDKAAILFGAGHGRGPDSLCALLGKDRVTRVELFTSSALYADKLNSLGAKAPDFVKSEEPHYVHIIDKGMVYRI